MVQLLSVRSRNSWLIAINLMFVSVLCCVLFSLGFNTIPILFSSILHSLHSACCSVLFLKLGGSHLIGLAVWEDTFVGPIRALPGTDGTRTSPGRTPGHIWVLKKHNAYCRVCKKTTHQVCVYICVTIPQA